MKPNIFTVFLISTIFLLISTTFYSVPNIPLVQANGGTTIYRGFANGWTDFSESRWTQAEFEELKNLGFNTILPSHFWWSKLENWDGSYNSEEINNINATIDLALAAGLNVFLSFGVSWGNDADEYYTWWTDWGYDNRPLANQVNYNQEVGGEGGRDRYANFLADMVSKFPQATGYCPWHFPYHNEADDAHKATYEGATTTAMINAIRSVDATCKIIWCPTHQGDGNNGERSDWYLTGSPPSACASDSNIMYGIGHLVPWSVVDGGNWDYDYDRMNTAFDGVDTWLTAYPTKKLFSVEYTPLKWDGDGLTQSRLACLEASLERMATYGCGWAYHRISQAHSGADDILYPDQAFELNHPLRDLLIKYLPPSIGFQSWQDGFESGDFSKWNGTQTDNGEATVTSTYAYQGSNSANFTADGSLGSYASSMNLVQNTTEIYLRSYVRFEDLPDTDDSRINVLRIAQEDGTGISIASVNRTGGNYYWQIREAGGGSDTLKDTIKVDQWYEMELYFNATANGNATLWINSTKVCEIIGDFSTVGNIARVYPYIFCGGANPQSSAKTVYHDNFRVDDVRIGGGTLACP